jgi:thioesterase domain-containing protein
MRNVVEFETGRIIKSASVAVRFSLLKYVLERQREWPQWIPSLSVFDIYGYARNGYTPGRVNAPVVLVRAGEGKDSDEPAIETVLDPLLGWGERTARPLQVIDAPGGHSSMLQEPNVSFIARRLIKLLEFESADATVPARVDGR